MWSLKFSPVVNIPNSYCTLVGTNVHKCKILFVVIVQLKSHRLDTHNHLNNHLYGFIP